MGVLEFTVTVNPLPAPRPRFGKTHTYMPKPYREYQDAIIRVIDALVIPEPFKGPLAVEIHFLRADKRRVDIDNLIKAAFDAITDSNSVWFDDSQVTRLIATKACDKECPCVSVRISHVGATGTD